MATKTLPITDDPAANELLIDEPLALTLGMLLDQQVPMEWAFHSPYRLKERLGALDAAAIAAMGPDAVEAVFREKPALHRYPASMGKRAHALCQHLVEHYGGDAEALWAGADSGAELYRRVRALPGFGEEKAKIFIALLAKRLGVRPEGWEAAAAPFSDNTPRSIADVSSAETLDQVRQWKKAQKAKGRSKQD